jgi:magnesium transporter
MNSTEPSEVFKYVPAPLSEVTKKKAFCIALTPTGKQLKIVGDSPVEFIPFLSNTDLAWIDFSVEDMSEAEKLAVSVGFISSLVPTLLGDYYSVYEDLDTELGMRLPAIVGKKFDVNTTPLLVLIRKHLILTIHYTGATRLTRFSRYAPTFLKKIDPELSMPDKLTNLLIRIIDENNNGNFDHLREIEAQGDEISRALLDTKTSRTSLAPEIYNMKHALIAYLDSLWATLDVISSLRYGDAELITDDDHLLTMFTILADDVNRQIALGEHMSEVLASGLEVLQSIYNNQLQILNNKVSLLMAWLTVIGTAVLVPNTIATIYGTPFFDDKGPQDLWWYALLLFVSMILSGWATYWWMKRKDLMPTMPDNL